jgi:hypothetical protein
VFSLGEAQIDSCDRNDQLANGGTTFLDASQLDFRTYAYRDNTSRSNRTLDGYAPVGRSTKTAAATTVVHNPSRSPIADCVILRVVTILSDSLQISLRSS